MHAGEHLLLLLLLVIWKNITNNLKTIITILKFLTSILLELAENV